MIDHSANDEVRASLKPPPWLSVDIDLGRGQQNVSCIKENIDHPPPPGRELSKENLLTRQRWPRLIQSDPKRISLGHLHTRPRFPVSLNETDNCDLSLPIPPPLAVTNDNAGLYPTASTAVMTPGSDAEPFIMQFLGSPAEPRPTAAPPVPRKRGKVPDTPPGPVLDR